MAIFSFSDYCIIWSRNRFLSPLSLQIVYNNTTLYRHNDLLLQRYVSSYGISHINTSDATFADCISALRISFCTFLSALTRFGSSFARNFIIAVQWLDSQRPAFYFLRHLLNIYAEVAQYFASKPSVNPRNILQFRLLRIACCTNNIQERGSLLRTYPPSFLVGYMHLGLNRGASSE